MVVVVAVIVVVIVVVFVAFMIVVVVVVIVIVVAIFESFGYLIITDTKLFKRKTFSSVINRNISVPNMKFDILICFFFYKS